MDSSSSSLKNILNTEFRNYIDLEKTSKDAYIYRMFPLNRFYQLFSDNSNTLVSPKLWDDPYENYIMQAQVAMPNGELVGYGFKDRYYGQCWTQRTYSDALWRIYSSDHRSVRVRSTIRKLAESLIAHHPDLRNSNCFIGKVKYQGNVELTDLANKVASTDNHGAILYAKTLLRKRRAFSHEKEIRLLFNDVENVCDGEIYQYDIDPHDLIDQIMIDPRIDKEEFIDIKNAIERRTKFQGSIVRSTLYDPPPRLIAP